MYQLIKKADTALNESEAEELVSEFENLVYRRFDDRKELLATKVDLAEMEKRINEQIASVRIDMSKDIASARVDLGKDGNRTYRSLLFWIIIMGILNVLPEIIEAITKSL